ncbi:TPA: methyltransferase [Candidatus Azambacteria bacterium]|nr:methyltransferase [Candidatus Azambacteria bacterium]
MIVENCRLCKSSKLNIVIDLGLHPLADTFLTEKQLNEKETFYPLRVQMCEDCGYAMSQYVVPAEERYQKNDYSYDSANSKVAVQHFEEMAEQIISRLQVSGNDLIVDIGSNVGTLLSAFRQKGGCRIIGVEPSANIAELAKKNNIPIVRDFFNAEAVKEILKIGKPKVITATNVFNHIDGLDDFMKDICVLIRDGGVFVFEVPYLLDLVEKTAFDTIYLEHVSYFSIQPLTHFLKQYNLAIEHIERNDYMGGSVRVYVRKKEEYPELTARHIEQEQQANLYKPETYELFMSRVKKLRYDLCRQIYEIKSGGGKIIGIGAATKGNTLLNYCKLDGNLLEYITDSSPLKIGKYTPGSHIKILSDQDIAKDITHALILPWNIAPYLKSKLRHLNLEFVTPQLEE